MVALSKTKCYNKYIKLRKERKKYENPIYSMSALQFY